MGGSWFGTRLVPVKENHRKKPFVPLVEQEPFEIPEVFAVNMDRWCRQKIMERAPPNARFSCQNLQIISKEEWLIAINHGVYYKTFSSHLVPPSQQLGLGNLVPHFWSRDNPPSKKFKKIPKSIRITPRHCNPKKKNLPGLKGQVTSRTRMGGTSASRNRRSKMDSVLEGMQIISWESKGAPKK